MSYYVLSRILDARHRPWKCSTITPDVNAAIARMQALGAARAIEAQIVHEGALTAAEISRYQTENEARQT